MANYQGIGQLLQESVCSFCENREAKQSLEYLTSSAEFENQDCSDLSAARHQAESTFRTSTKAKSAEILEEVCIAERSGLWFGVNFPCKVVTALSEQQREAAASLPLHVSAA